MTTNTADTPSSTGISTDQAATAFESLLTGPADTQEERETAAAGEHEEHEHEETETEVEETEEHEDPENAETEETEETEGEQGEKPQTVEIEGKPVTLDELTKGYLRQSDYTRKTTELATQRQAIAAEAAQTQQMREQYAQALNEASALIKQLEPAEPDWNALYQADPGQYAAAREMWRSYKEQQAVIEQQKQITAQHTSAEQAKAAREFVQAQSGKLIEALPAWKDPKVKATEQAQIREFAKSRGFSDEELNTIADHRAIVMLREAMLFSKTQAAKANLKPNGERPASKVKPATPGSQATKPNSASAQTQARQRLVKSGKVADAASALELLM